MEACILESCKLESPIHLKASGCWQSDTKQKFTAHRVDATANYEVKGTSNACAFMPLVLQPYVGQFGKLETMLAFKTKL